LIANTRLLLFMRDISYPAAEGPHLWRAAASAAHAHIALDAIRFLLSHKYPLPESPGTLFTATEFDAFAAVAEHAPACELIDSLAAAGFPPSRTAMGHAARRGNFPLAKALRQARCVLSQQHVESAWRARNWVLSRWMHWQLGSFGPQAVGYRAEADTQTFSHDLARGPPWLEAPQDGPADTEGEEEEE